MNRTRRAMTAGGVAVAIGLGAIGAAAALGGTDAYRIVGVDGAGSGDDARDDDERADEERGDDERGDDERGDDDKDAPAAGAEAQRAGAAALGQFPGDRVTAIERDAGGDGAWEVEIMRSDGARVDVDLDERLRPLAVDDPE